MPYMRTKSDVNVVRSIAFFAAFSMVSALPAAAVVLTEKR